MVHIGRSIVHLVFLFVVLCYSFASVEARRRSHHLYRDGIRCTKTVTALATYATTTTEYVGSYTTITLVETLVDVETSLTTIYATETSEVVATNTVTETVYTAPPAAPVAPGLDKRSPFNLDHRRCKTVTEYLTTIPVYTETHTIDSTPTAYSTDYTTTFQTQEEYETTTTTETVSTTTQTVQVTDNAYLCSSSMFMENIDFIFTVPSGDAKLTSSQVGAIDSTADCCTSCFGLPGCIAWEYQPSNCTVTAIINEPVKACGIPVVDFTGGTTTGSLSGVGPCGVLADG